MSNQRRRETGERLGFDSQNDQQKQLEAIEKERKRREEKERISQRIRESKSYRILISGAIGFDILDAFLGIFEFFGDALSFVVGLGYVYISAFVVRHLRLSLAVLFVLLTDLLIGFIPVIGTAFDIVFPASYICRNMIQGVVDHDKKQIRLVNIISISGFFIVAGMFALVYWLISYFTNR
ncbi:MAG: DUF4112 domain-containing protein [Paludibacteraceae bacterium]|nr:DUF4112 domain-containing protein [Paludibacteraceae bacterium]